MQCACLTARCKPHSTLRVAAQKGSQLLHPRHRASFVIPFFLSIALLMLVSSLNRQASRIAPARGQHAALHQHLQVCVRPPHRFTCQPVRAAEEARGVELDLAVQMSSPQGSQLAYILTSGEGNDRVLYEPAVRTYLTELQQERDMEAAMEAASAQEAAAAKEAATTSSSDPPESGYDVNDTWNDDELMRRIRAVREAERGHVVSDILYLEAVRQLQTHGYQLLNNLALLSPAISQPPADFVSSKTLASSKLLSPAVIDAIVQYLLTAFSSTDPEYFRDKANMSPPNMPLSVDRVQAARLYGGLLEFGYFAAALEAACLRDGVAVGNTSEEMIQYADSLNEEQLRQMCAVRSADGWWAVVRHIGTIFGLKPNEDPFDSFGLPYPDLSVTISQIKTEPVANLWEHYNTPGASAKLAAKAADKSARGWSGQGPDEGSLPDADLVTFEFELFRRLLLEGSVFGSVLFGAEQCLEQQYGYQLSSRKDREAHAGKAAF